MKRIIAFVFLGLLIYAGVFVIYYSYEDLKISAFTPTDISNLTPEGFYTGLAVGGSVYQVLDEIRTETVQSKIVGIPVGEPIKQHYYVLPLKTQYKYMLIAVSDERDLEIIEQIKTKTPKERDPDAPALEFIGVAGEIPPLDRIEIKSYLLAHLDLIGIGDDVFVRPIETLVTNHIVPYTIYVKHPSKADYVPLIIGIAMCVVGIGLTVLLILRIKREKEYY